MGFDELQLIFAKKIPGNHEKNNTWSIKCLVEDSFVPLSKQPSVLNCKLTDFCTRRNRSKYFYQCTVCSLCKIPIHYCCFIAFSQDQTVENAQDPSIINYSKGMANEQLIRAQTSQTGTRAKNRTALQILKTGSDQIIYCLGRYSFLLVLIISKNLRGTTLCGTGYRKRTPQILRVTHFYDLLMQ